MDWKDTIISPKEIEAIPLGVQDEHHKPTIGSGLKGDSKLFNAIAEAQAERAFPLGKKEGRREVVEWVKKESSLWDKGYPFTEVVRVMNEQRWQAKLKEWEVEEG